MAIPKKFFNDHLILLLLSINVFLTFSVIIFVLLKLGTGHGSGYIVQYRPSLGVGAFQTGSIRELFGFVGFAMLVLTTHTILSMRVYLVRRQLAIATLSLGILLLLLTIIISNALLSLR